MKKLMIVLVIFCMGSAARLNAQSLSNTVWKGYFGDPVNDTIVLHFKTDSSFATKSNGEVVVQSRIKVVKDTLTLSDVDGAYACPSVDGVYKFAISGDNLVYTLVNDPCEGRQAIVSIKWIRANGK